MRVYLSGAITGTDDYMERFARAQMLLQNEGHSVINPALICLKVGRSHVVQTESMVMPMQII